MNDLAAIRERARWGNAALPQVMADRVALIEAIDHLIDAGQSLRRHVDPFDEWEGLAEWDAQVAAAGRQEVPA